MTTLPTAIKITLLFDYMCGVYSDSNRLFKINGLCLLFLPFIKNPIAIYNFLCKLNADFKSQG